jgi:hypothetical protein
MPETDITRAGERIITAGGKNAGGGMFANHQPSPDEISSGFDFDPPLTERVRSVVTSAPSVEAQYRTFVHDVGRISLPKSEHAEPRTIGEVVKHRL